MRLLALTAALALMGVGTVAEAQMPTRSTTTVVTPGGTRTTTTTTMHRDGMSGRTDSRTVVRTRDWRGHRNGWHKVRRCKTWWNHGRRVRSCKWVNVRR